MANKERKFYGTGRRKSSTARVTLVPGTGKITVKDLEPEGYSVGFEVIQYRPLYISATLPDEEFLKYMKQELRNKAFIFARYYETTLVPDSNRPLAKFVR